MTQERIALRASADDPNVAYLTLPDHPGAGTKGCAARQVRLSDLISYIGADIILDLDADGRLIGIEVLA
ncbi:DUF2283 domain-containing protein [Bradyrhizobium aeschynomenes]|uniref:DUF2283 domain-containing protein n=1 Tax=Bradyrhizobium aeschynomenes TaxID=2734909 RepID=UPI00155441FA|nr:DUF2283 domain-containing protein [Bradyrhizobium aeschynomenes]NPV21101.1 DUF2283 domain-containing protein [Bradyrhizobium aeschynomenes]